MKSKRIQWLDFAKGLAIFFVVFAHSSDFSGNFRILQYILFTFVMPVFFSVSGFLYKPTTTIHKYSLMIYKKITSIIIPYLIFTSVYFCFCLITHSFTIHIILHYLCNAYLMPIGKVGYLWFLYSLVLIFLIVGILDLFHLSIFHQIIVISLLLITQMSDLVVHWQIVPNDINYIAGALGYIAFFYLGHLIHRYIKQIYQYLSNIYYIILMLIVWIVIIVYQMNFTGIMYNTNLVTYKDFISKFLSVMIFFAFSIIVKNNSWLFKYFDQYGKYTLVIYLVHIPVLIIFNKIFKAVTLNRVILLPLFVLFTWITSIVICKLANKYELMHMIFYPRKYINNLVIRTKWGKELLKKD